MKKRILFVILICVLAAVLVWLVNFGIIGRIIEISPEMTTTSTTTTPVTTTLLTTIPTTTTLEDATTTIQVRKSISVIAYSCDRETDIITLTISNRGNTRIEEDEIEIYINDEYTGTFGKAIEPGRLSKNSIQGIQGLNIVKTVSPSNSVRIVIHCY